MIKTFAITSTITAMWSSPVVALLFLVALVFLIDLFNRYQKSKQIVCFFAEEKSPICVPTDLSMWGYNDLSTMARLHNLKPSNRKKQTLINLLQEL